MGRLRSPTTRPVSTGEIGGNLADERPPLEMQRHKHNRWWIINTSDHIHGYTLDVVDNCKYLGVTFSKDFTWRKHIETTVNKANKTLGFVWPNLSECTARVKSTAYTTYSKHLHEISNSVFLIFSRKQDLTFPANYLQWRQFVRKVKSCFLGKIIKNINFLYSELAQRMVKVYL